MPPELQAAVQQAAQKIAEFVDNVSTLTVITSAVDVANPGQERLLAKTTFKLDGDTVNTLPITVQDGTLTINKEILDLHNASVDAAMKYRAEAVQSLLHLIRG